MAIAPLILLRRPPLDRQQLGVVAHGSGPMLVLAGPGSGKTTAICVRAADLLATVRVDPQNLLLCTFTRSAAREMRGRLRVAPAPPATLMMCLGFGSPPFTACAGGCFRPRRR